MPPDSHSEQARIDQIAADSWYAKGASGASVRYLGRVFRRHFRGGRCLELGPAEGMMTPFLAEAFAELTLVEGSAQFCSELRARFPEATVTQSLFEGFHPDGLFDAIVLGHVLEHVESPIELLASVRTWLAPEGTVYAGVPNARSVHRQAAVIMRMLRSERALNETDQHHGHRRVYDPESFRADFLAAGFNIAVFGGYWLKPLSNGQIDESWSPEMLDAFMQLGERYPDIAAEIYVIASA
jgi:2-polyprenyl-3-methyl-5-hydroxy-6-metoxy-1,4-benzoquinol methylase